MADDLTPDTPDDDSKYIGTAAPPKSANYDNLVAKHATRTGLDPNLVHAVIGQESGGSATARSPKGAGGLMQLIPATAARFGVTNVNDPEQNIRGGTDYLKFLSNRYGGDVDKTLAAYNAGEGNVDKYGGIPPFKETQQYVPAVKARYQKLTGRAVQQQDPADAKYVGSADTGDDDSKYLSGGDEPPQQPKRPAANPWAGLTGGMGASQPTGGMQGIDTRQSDQLANDISWHFGDATLRAFRQLDGVHQQQIIKKAAQLRLADEAKKQRGESMLNEFGQDAPSPAWQLQNRQALGLDKAGPVRDALVSELTRNQLAANQTPEAQAEQLRQRSAEIANLPWYERGAISGLTGIGEAGAGITRAAGKVGTAFGHPGLEQFGQDEASVLGQGRQLLQESQQTKPANLLEKAEEGLITYAPLMLAPNPASIAGKIATGAATFGGYSGLQEYGRGGTAGQALKVGAEAAPLGALLGVPKTVVPLGSPFAQAAIATAGKVAGTYGLARLGGASNQEALGQAAMIGGFEAPGLAMEGLGAASRHITARPPSVEGVAARTGLEPAVDNAATSAFDRLGVSPEAREKATRVYGQPEVADRASAGIAVPPPPQQDTREKVNQRQQEIQSRAEVPHPFSGVSPEVRGQQLDDAQAALDNQRRPIAKSAEPDATASLFGNPWVLHDGEWYHAKDTAFAHPVTVPATIAALNDQVGRFEGQGGFVGEKRAELPQYGKSGAGEDYDAELNAEARARKAANPEISDLKIKLDLLRERGLLDTAPAEPHPSAAQKRTEIGQFDEGGPDYSALKAELRDNVRQLERAYDDVAQHKARKQGLANVNERTARDYFTKLRSAVAATSPDKLDLVAQAKAAYDAGDNVKATVYAERALTSPHDTGNKANAAVLALDMLKAGQTPPTSVHWLQTVAEMRKRAADLKADRFKGQEGKLPLTPSVKPAPEGIRTGTVADITPEEPTKYDLRAKPTNGVANPTEVAKSAIPLYEKLKAEANAKISDGSLDPAKFTDYVRTRMNARDANNPIGTEDWHRTNERAAYKIITDLAKRESYDPASHSFRTILPSTSQFVDDKPLNFRIDSTDRTTARDLRREYSGAKNEQVVIGNNMAKQGKAEVKDKLAQDAIYFFNAVGGDEAKLRSYLANPDKRLDPYRPAIQRALELKPWERKWANTLRKGYDELGDYSRALGTIRNVKEDYHNRIYVADKEGKDFVQSETFRKGLNQYTGHSKAQIYANALDAVLGHLPDGSQGTPKKLAVTNAFDAYSILNEEMARVNTNAKFREAMSAAGLGMEVPAGNIPTGYKALPGMGRELPIATDERLGYKRKWGWNQPGEDGATILRREFVVPEGIEKGLRAITDPGLQNPFLNKVNEVQGRIKTLDLALSAFHHLAMLHTLIAQTKGGLDILTKLPQMRKWAESGELNAAEQDFVRHTGMTTRVESNADVVRNLIKGDDVLSRATRLPIIKQTFQAAERSSDFLFDNIQRKMKVLDYANKAAAWVGDHPKATDRQITDAKRSIASEINAAYGGLNWTALGVSKSTLGLMRLVLLAPDWCTDSKTRAMTKTGWKYHHELQIGDEIMAFDPASKQLRWIPLKDKYERADYSGPMVAVHNYGRDIMVTPDHTCYVRNFSLDKFEILKAGELRSNHLIPRTAPYSLPVIDAPFTDDFLRTVGWFVTDGHVAKTPFKLASGQVKVYHYGKITQSKPHTVEMIKDLGFTYHTEPIPKSHEHDGKEIVTNYSRHRFNIPKPLFIQIQQEGLEDGLNWQFLEKLSRRQLELLRATMMLGDGTGQNRFCGQEQEVFYMTLIQTLLGESSTFYQQEEKCWRTRPVKAKYIDTYKRREVYYEGTIWCPSVETGFWLAERDGLVFITGNTTSNILLPAKIAQGGPGAKAAASHIITSTIASSLATVGLNHLLHGDTDKARKLLAEGKYSEASDAFVGQRELGHELEVELAPGVYIPMFRGGISDITKIIQLYRELGPARGSLQFASNKLAPFPRTIIGAISNTVNGRPILVPYNPSESWLQNTAAQLKQTGQMVRPALPIPLGVSQAYNYVTRKGEKPSALGLVTSLSGAGRVTNDTGPRTEMEKYMYRMGQLQGKTIYEPGTDAESKYQLKSGLMDQMRKGQRINQPLSDAVRAGQLGKNDVQDIIKGGQIDLTIERFKALKLDNAIDAYKLANPDERKQIDSQGLLQKKIKATMPQLSPNEQKAIMLRLKELQQSTKPSGVSRAQELGVPMPIPARGDGEDDIGYRARLLQLGRQRSAKLDQVANASDFGTLSSGAQRSALHSALYS